MSQIFTASLEGHELHVENLCKGSAYMKHIILRTPDLMEEYVLCPLLQFCFQSFPVCKSVQQYHEKLRNSPFSPFGCKGS